VRRWIGGGGAEAEKLRGNTGLGEILGDWGEGRYEG